MKCLILFLIPVFISLQSCHSQPSENSTGITLVSAFPRLSFTRPVDFQAPQDGTTNLYVVEQQGRIFRFQNSNDVQEKHLFLDITDRVNDSGNEEGLLGLAFHPAFKTNGFFYVNYTAEKPRRTVIARYQLERGMASARKTSEKIILEIPQPYSNHNGGQLSFGWDGFLYIALGDGGSAGDPLNNGQNPGTLLGSILRIDIDHPSGILNYSIPGDNPFKGNSAGYREEIYAYGLRNPWRFSFDPVTQKIWTGDVGQNEYEEIDVIVKGGNYGWNFREGFHPFRSVSGSDTLVLVEPVWEYPHKVGQSITGGIVYRGSVNKTLQGYYIYADYVSGVIWRLRISDRGTVENDVLMDTDLNISSFGIDSNYELYFCAFDGKIYTFQSNAGY